MIGKAGLPCNRGKTRKIIKKGQKNVKKSNNLDLHNSFEIVKKHECKMSSFWWKEIQLIVNAWLCLEARWIHSKHIPAFFEVRDLKRMWPGSGLADKNGRDYGIEGKFCSGWRN